jgi:hypothetical protein
MTLSNRKSYNPAGLLATILDENGLLVSSGDEKDIREFNDIFINRLTEALHSLQNHKTAQQIKSLLQGQCDEYRSH